MVNEKPKKVVKKSAGKAESSSKKATTKKRSAVKKKGTTVQKKKSPVKKETTSNGKKLVAKKVTKKPAAKSKPKVSTVKRTTITKAKKPAAKRKPVKMTLKKVTTNDNADLQIKEATKTQIKKVENVIEKLSQKTEQNYITTVPGVFRKVPSAQKRKPALEVHKELPIAGMLNYFKKMF